MNFDLNEDQLLLKTAVDKFLSNEYSFDQRKRYQAEPDGWSRRIWKEFADQGLLSLPFDPAHGGMGGGAIETMIVEEAFGRALLLEPFTPTVVIAGAALRLAGNPAQLHRFVPGIVSGDSLFAPATLERQSRHNWHDVATSAEVRNGDFVINGHKVAVQNGDCANWLIVSARSSGSRDSRSGISLFLVDSRSPGVTVRTYFTQHGTRAADLTFQAVAIPRENLLGRAGDAAQLLERLCEVGIAALAAEAAGAVEACLSLTTDYLKQRRQFGVFIGTFQALQHRAAEMLMELEQVRSAAIYAALMLDEPTLTARRCALSAVKYQLGKSTRLVGQLAVQLHGGIGVTEEYSVGHYFRRLAMMELEFGDSDLHLSRYCENC